jgi:electron-transferring-flavoprotein dehydrogenase
MAEENRQVLDVDVLFVGAGPASLAGALHLKKLTVNAGLDISIAIIDKAREIGAHSLSGAIIDPRSLNELIPDHLEQGVPFEAEVTEENMYYLSSKGKIRFPYIPKPMSHHGCYLVSLGQFIRWLGKICETEGIDVFCGFPGSELLYENKQVIGVRTGDRGIDKHGNPKSNYDPGVDIHAKVTVLGEGARGSLSKTLINRHNLMKDKNPQVWALGVKELWQMPKGTVKEGYVAHTMGFPLGHNIFGGAFIYGMKNDILNMGLVVGLDYKDPSIDPHHELQLFKTHPWIRSLIKDGKMIAYGAKSLPEGGYYSLPKLTVDGAMLIGDSAGFMNGQRLKGIHLAMKSGMEAAETILSALLKNDFSDSMLTDFQRRIDNSWIKKELYKVRNFHQAFDHGLISGMINAGIGLVFNGRAWGIIDRLSSKNGHENLNKSNSGSQSNKTTLNKYEKLNYDGKYLFDKVTNVYHSATAHDEDQVPHLHVSDTNICISKCAEEYGNPCENFCPADVYEMTGEKDDRRLQINFSNCVHCKTCDIMDPYQIINWVPPEGGDGPGWINL